jgi:geranylgeranyl pyrophosphate synthase
MISILIGQGWDIEMNTRTRIPSIDNYLDTALCKTGIPRLIIKLIEILINKPEYDSVFQEFIHLAEYLSISFQIKDDLLNITDSSLSKGKDFLGEDIYTGKMTLIVLHTLNGDFNNKNRLKEILSMRTKSEKMINEAILILKNNGSIDYSTKVMNKYSKLVFEKCKKLLNQNSVNFNLEAAENLVEMMNCLSNRQI